MKLFNLITRAKSRGQSFIELALVFMVLMMLFAGVVELGNLINIYLDIIDSGREAARFSNAAGNGGVAVHPAFVGVCFAGWARSTALRARAATAHPADRCRTRDPQSCAPARLLRGAGGGYLRPFSTHVAKRL